MQETSAKGTSQGFRALEAGALAVVLRPPAIGQPAHIAAARELVQTVKMMAEIRVIKRITREGGTGPVGARGGQPHFCTIIFPVYR